MSTRPCRGRCRPSVAALTGQLVERVGVRSAVQSPLLDANGVPVEGGAPVDTAVWARAVGLVAGQRG